MIYSKDGDVVIKGTIPEILADLDILTSCIVKGMANKIGKVKTVEMVSDILINGVSYGIEQSKVE